MHPYCYYCKGGGFLRIGWFGNLYFFKVFSFCHAVLLRRICYFCHLPRCCCCCCCRRHRKSKADNFIARLLDIHLQMVDEVCSQVSIVIAFFCMLGLRNFLELFQNYFMEITKIAFPQTGSEINPVIS